MKRGEDEVEDEELEAEEFSEDEEEFPENGAESEDEAETEAEAGAPAEDSETSLDEILSTRPEEQGGEDEDDESVLAMDRDERIESLSVKVVPQQPTEFTCRKCYLVKHRSQLADRKRMLCRDCA